jgi:methionyl-tRNA synthetase
MVSKAKDKFYITTAIDYVNGKPHIGHAFEKCIADALARWARLSGKETFFLTGTDENAQKNVEAAEKAKTPVKKFVDQNSEAFKDLCKNLNISYNRFIRTTEPDHIKKSQEIFQKVFDKGDIYKGEYQGLYCKGEESFITERELINGKCPNGEFPVEMSEEAYFFKLSKYHKQIEKFIKSYIHPESRQTEILSRLKEPLKDISVTRKSLNWGIDTPIDSNHKIYVWFDALINYISGSPENWPADVHVIGKDINWFHSVIWPGMLISAGIELPKKLLVHGFLNLKGEKMSKSKGNVLDPIELSEKYSSDSVRYSLLKSNLLEDSDYSEEILIQRHNDELADKLGNLVSRVSTLAEKYGLESFDCKSLNSKKTLKKVSKHLENFELDRALNEIFTFIDSCNEFIQNKKPWETHDKKVLYELSNAIKDIAILLSPFIPETSEKISKVFNFNLSLKELEKPLKVSKIKKSPILFQKIK